MRTIIEVIVVGCLLAALTMGNIRVTGMDSNVGSPTPVPVTHHVTVHRIQEGYAPVALPSGSSIAGFSCVNAGRYIECYELIQTDK